MDTDAQVNEQDIICKSDNAMQPQYQDRDATLSANKNTSCRACAHHDGVEVPRMLGRIKIILWGSDRMVAALVLIVDELENSWWQGPRMPA